MLIGNRKEAQALLFGDSNSSFRTKLILWLWVRISPRVPDLLRSRGEVVPAGLITLEIVWFESHLRYTVLMAGFQYLGSTTGSAAASKAEGWLAFESPPGCQTIC